MQVCNVSRVAGEARCANGGECLDGLGEDFTCICSQGWEGDTCEEEVMVTALHLAQVDECLEEPCLNDGHCNDLLGEHLTLNHTPLILLTLPLPGGFSCSCPITWTGRRCEERVER